MYICREKKNDFNIEGKSLLEDFKNNLGITSLEEVRVVNKYTLGEMKEEDYKKLFIQYFRKEL